MKNYIKLYSLLILTILPFTGCETTDLDLLDSPNAVTPNNADPTLLLSNIQLAYIDFLYEGDRTFEGLNRFGMELSRMDTQFGSYTGPFAGTASLFNIPWREAYRETLQDIQVLLPVAEERELNFHLGVAKLIQAHTLTVLVDFFGDVPFSEAFQGDINPSPMADNGEALYDLAFQMIDEAINHLQDDSAPPINDLFYGGDQEAWITWANTLKLKMYNTIRLVDPNRSAAGIDAILSSRNFIDEISEDFQFQYSTSGTPAESRHPEFVQNYSATNASDYMSNYYIYLLKDDKGLDDPRLKYYMYRQTLNAPSGSNLPCAGDPDYDYCYLGEGYWGRDHADNAGVPADQNLRTTWGLYPAGGKFDDGSAQSTGFSLGAQGAGIFPIYLSSFTHFTLAESALMLGTLGDPKTLLETAIRQSMTKVISFGSKDPAYDAESFEPTEEEIQAYIDYVFEEYDEATDNQGRLAIIIREYYLAAWGNGLETYNNLRRTGYPDVQDPVKPSGAFPRTVLYPLNYVDLNSNTDVKPVTVKVFWDTNPDDFIQ